MLVGYIVHSLVQVPHLPTLVLLDLLITEAKLIQAPLYFTFEYF